MADPVAPRASDARVESYMTAHVIDIRNGYFYCQLDASERGGEAYATVYESDHDAEATLQWGRLVPQMSRALSRRFTSRRQPATPVVTPASAPPAAAPAAAKMSAVTP